MHALSHFIMSVKFRDLPVVKVIRQPAISFMIV